MLEVGRKYRLVGTFWPGRELSTRSDVLVAIRPMTGSVWRFELVGERKLFTCLLAADVEPVPEPSPAPEVGALPRDALLDEMARHVAASGYPPPVDRYAASRALEESASAWLAAQSPSEHVDQRCPNCDEVVTWRGARAQGRRVCGACGKTVRHG